MVTRNEGISFEEAPHSTPTFILNGWLSALENINLYAESSGSNRARTMFDESVPLLKALLPSFDLPDLRNSRYSLAGPVPFRLELPLGMDIEAATLMTPSGRSVDFDFSEPEKWGVDLSGTTGAVDGSLVYSVPTTSEGVNQVRLEVESAYGGNVSFSAPKIAYDVLRWSAPMKWSGFSLNA